MAVEIRYDLVGRGWAECTVRIGDAHAAIRASFLSDALHDLASGVSATLRGHPCATAAFVDEPGEYRWLFEPRPGGRVRVRILEFDERRDLPTEEGVQIFEGECRLRTFAGALVSELQRLEREHGAAGYREKWVNYDFPADRLKELRELLQATTEPPATLCADRPAS